MAEPKYRFVKMKKPPRGRGVRGAMARQKFQRSGGRKKQILNPETGKYVDVLSGEAGKRQLQKFYPTKERGESIKKVEKAKVEQSKRKTKAQKKFDAAVEETKKKRKEKEAKAKRAAAKPKAEPTPPKLPAVTAADDKAQLASIFEKGRAERGARSEPAPPSAPVAKNNKFKELLDKIDAEGGKLAGLPPLPLRPTAPQPVTEITEDSPPPTTGRLTRGPGSEAPPPPPRIRITEEKPKPPVADLSELPIRDQKELNAVLKDLKNRVISPDFRTPTRDEIAEAVTKATGGRFTPPTTKVAEPPPPKAEPVVPSKGTKLFGKLEIDPNASELDKLKKRYNILKDTRFITDPGPEYFQGLKKLEEQIMALDPNFVGEFSSSRTISEPTKVDIPGAGQVTLPKFRAPGDTDFKIISPGGPGPGPKVPITLPEPNLETTDSKLEPTPVVPAPTPAPPPPQFVNMDPLRGVRERYVPTNILGQSFDPGVRENYARRMMQAGANVQQGGAPTFQMPTSAVPQVQFGGYGAPVPMAPLAPYAGLGGPLPPPPPPQLASGAVVNPGTGEVEPIGYVPPSIIQGPIT
jgi:hypothetical protein